jgi:hypothetical protein
VVVVVVGGLVVVVGGLEIGCLRLQSRNAVVVPRPSADEGAAKMAAWPLNLAAAEVIAWLLNVGAAAEVVGTLDREEVAPDAPENTRELTSAASATTTPPARAQRRRTGDAL